ncbi:hypothetical protein Pyrfu_1854 [Pyrolobus fumarii 1A]|uniref:Uncharacterized protein n=1 Tax=Pyrolobus fumarii (strain DSM 11204 / 1A) TaxID=694429 RepID=G0ECY7_PYRF1|nr:hypothetical protein [Pyrolobus fumarii]AEM39707.1 hypothetical protein Pyrfu_1854 [Pyrolobus fumarii 1A]
MRRVDKLNIVVMLPPDLAESLRGLGSSVKQSMLDQLASALESGDVKPEELPDDPLRCARGSRPKTVTLRASRDSYQVFRSHAERMGVSVSQLIRRLVAWYMGYECRGAAREE